MRFIAILLCLFCVSACGNDATSSPANAAVNDSSAAAAPPPDANEPLQTEPWRYPRERTVDGNRVIVYTPIRSWQDFTHFEAIAAIEFFPKRRRRALRHHHDFGRNGGRPRQTPGHRHRAEIRPTYRFPAPVRTRTKWRCRRSCFANASKYRSTCSCSISAMKCSKIHRRPGSTPRRRQSTSPKRRRCCCS